MNAVRPFRAMPTRCVRVGIVTIGLAFRLTMSAHAAIAADGEALVTMRSGPWLAACDNGRACTLFGFADDDSAVLRVELPRGNDPSGSLLLRPDHPLSADVIRMQFGRRGPTLVLHGVPVAAGQFRAQLDNGSARELLAGLHQSGRLFVAASPPGRTRSAPLAALRLAGAGAALDWIGRVQRRPADPGGAIAAAPLVDPDQPPPPEMPPSVVKALPAVQSCAAVDSTQPGQANAGQRLPGGAVLWRIPCGSGNFSQDSLFVLQRGTGVPVLATFPAPVQFPVRAPGMLVNAAIDADGSLVAIEPSRGLNDCGDVRRYRWDGVRFHLVLAQLMSACHGLPPEEWPVVYRAAGN